MVETMLGQRQSQPYTWDSRLAPSIAQLARVNPDVLAQLLRHWRVLSLTSSHCKKFIRSKVRSSSSAT
eukprot:6323711-Amphidinium_carterae.2